jgi:hypothetical protein
MNWRPLLLLTLVGSANADEIIVHVGSVHDEKIYNTGGTHTVRTDWSQLHATGKVIRYWQYDTRPINNSNPGLGYGWSNGWAVGGYRNSYYQTSVYVARTWLTECYLPGVECGATLGLASGYKAVAGSGIMPITGVVARFHVAERWAVNLTGIPTLSSSMTGVVHFYLSYRLN